MLQTSVLGKAYDIWLQSTVFALLQSIFRAFSRAFENSRIVHVFVRDNRVERIYAGSLIARFFKLIFDLIYQLFACISSAVRRWSQGSFTAAFCHRFLRTSFFFSFETLLGGFICLMFIIPHDYWSNTYALLGVLALTGLYFILVGAGVRKPYYIHDMGLPVLLFAIACVLGVYASFDRSDSLRVFLFYATALLLLYIISADVTTEKRLMKLLGFVYLAVTVTALYAVYQRFVGVDVSASLTDLTVNDGVPGRVYSTLANPNNYAEFLVMLTPVAAVFAAKFRKGFIRFVLCCGMALPFIALLMTYSRSCWISMLLACVVFVYYSNKKLIPAFFLLCVAAIPLLPDSVMIRIASLFSEDSSKMFRIYIWSGATGIARDYLATGIGLGPNSFAEIYPAYAHPMAEVGAPHSHMVYLELIIELGVLGFVSFMWYMLRLWKDAACSLLSSRSKLVRLVLCACLAGLVGIAVTFGVEYVWYYPRTFFTYFILAGITTAAIRINSGGKACGELSLKRDE